MQITKEKILEIKSKITDYHQLYSEFIDDIPNNKRKVFIPCLWHNETKGSLQIDLETGCYRCWGCGKSGDIVTFYMDYFGYSFTDSVKTLAEKFEVSLEVSEEEQAKYDRTKKLYQINQTICNGFQKALQNDTNALSYLTEIRKLEPSTIKNFRLGRGIDELPEKESLEILGLKYGGKSVIGSDRITIPLIDEFGHVTSYIGRQWKDQAVTPKYKYTTNTEIHSKSEHIFGLYQAKQYIKTFKSVILSEGQLDCISMHQNGISNSVAIGGLYLSEKQILLLKKYTNTFYIVVEDGAILGLNANDPKPIEKSPLSKMYESIREHIPFAKIYILDLRNKDGSKCDPDEFLKEHNAREFRNKLKEARIYNEFVLEQKIKSINPKNIEEKSACLNFIVPILCNINNFMDRKQYIELISNKLAISENDIYRAIKRYDSKKLTLNINNIVWDERPVYAQKILLSICFCDKFDPVHVCGLVHFKALSYMEDYYKNILKEVVYPYFSSEEFRNGTKSFKDFINEKQYDDTIDKDIKKILLDSYMKSEQFEDLDKEDVSELIDEQIETLQEWSFNKEVELDIVV